MNRLTVHVQTGFVENFRQSRMGEYHHLQVFGTGTKFHGDHSLHDDLRRLGTHDMDTQDTICFLVRNHFHETGGFVGCSRSTIGQECEGAGLVLITGRFHLLFSLADPCHFRMGIYHGRNAVIIYCCMMASNNLRDNDAFLSCLMSKRGSAHNIPDSINAGNIGCALIVHKDEAALIQVDATVCSKQISSNGTAAYSHDESVYHHFLFAIGIGVIDCHFVVGNGSTGHTSGQTNIEPLLLQVFQ